MNVEQDYEGLANPRVRLRVMLGAWALLLLTAPIMYAPDGLEVAKPVWFLCAVAATGIPSRVEPYFAYEVLRSRHPEEWAELGASEGPWLDRGWSAALRRARVHRYLVWSGGHPDELIRGGCLNLWLSYLAMAVLVVAIVNTQV